MNPQRRRTPVGLIVGTVAVLAPIRAASPFQAPMGHMDMQLGASAPPPAICQLLGSSPVVIPATLENAPMVAPLLRMVDVGERAELAIDVGPVDIPAHGMPAESRQLVYQLTQFPLDAWVHGFRLELTDARGRPVPRSVLHHIDTTRPAARDLFLPVAQRFVALGSETGSQNLPGWLAGVRIYRGEPLLVSTMLHNPTATAYTGVRVRLVLAYTRTRPLYEVAGFRLDVMLPTGPMEYDLPPGRSVRSWEGSPQVPARILGLTGHLHRYAEWIELRDVTTNKVLWRARPRVDAAGELTGMPVSFPRLGLGRTIYPSHRYRVTASYWNPTGTLIRDGAMAKLAGVFTPLRPLALVDVRDSLYQADLRYLLGLGCGTGAMPEVLAHASHPVGAAGAAFGHVVH